MCLRRPLVAKIFESRSIHGTSSWGDNSRGGGFILGGFSALGGLGMALGGAVLSRMASGSGLGMLASLGGAVLGAIFFGFAVIYIVDAVGLLKVANWARILTVVLVALHLLRSAFGLLRAAAHVHPIGLFFS